MCSPRWRRGPLSKLEAAASHHLGICVWQKGSDRTRILWLLVRRTGLVPLCCACRGAYRDLTARCAPFRCDRTHLNLRLLTTLAPGPQGGLRARTHIAERDSRSRRSFRSSTQIVGCARGTLRAARKCHKRPTHPESALADLTTTPHSGADGKVPVDRGFRFSSYRQVLRRRFAVRMLAKVTPATLNTPGFSMRIRASTTVLSDR